MSLSQLRCSSCFNLHSLSSQTNGTDKDNNHTADGNAKRPQASIENFYSCKCQTIPVYWCEPCLNEKIKADGSKRCTTCCSEPQAITDFETMNREVVSSQSKDDYSDNAPLLSCSLATTANFPCDAEECGSVAANYCVKCARSYCSTHLKSHNALSPSHSLLSWEEYQRDPKRPHLLSTCRNDRRHTDHVCQKCYKSSCSVCELKAEESVCSVDSQEHDWKPQKEVSKKIDRLLNEKVRQATVKVDEYETKKERYRCEVKNLYEKLRDDKRKEEDNQNSYVRKNIVHMEQQIKSHYEHGNKMCAEYREEVEEKVENLETLKSEAEKLIREQMLVKFTNCQQLIDRLSAASALPVPSCTWRQPLVFVHNFTGSCGAFRGLRQVPKSIEYLNLAHKTESCCYDVSFQGTGTLWVATDNGLKYYDIRADSSHVPHVTVSEHTLKEGPCVSVAPYAAMIYFAIEPRLGSEQVSIGKVKALVRQAYGRSERENKRECSSPVALFDFCIEDDHPAVLASSENFLALADKKNKKVIIYNLLNGNLESYELAQFPTSVCFHPNGNLLVTDHQNGKLFNYHISADGVPDMISRQVVEDLCEPDAIAVDHSGFIFVKSQQKKVIYVLSDGILHTELKKDCIYTTYGGITISGNEMNMAGFGEKEFRSFTIQYEE